MRSSIDFGLIYKYKTHTKNTINVIKQYFEIFHQLKDVLSEFCVGKRDKRTIAKLLVKNLCQLETEVLDDIPWSNPWNKDVDSIPDIDGY